MELPAIGETLIPPNDFDNNKVLGDIFLAEEYSTQVVCDKEEVDYNKNTKAGNKKLTDAIINVDTHKISEMSRDELKENVPDDWSYEEHNDRVHIKDATGNYKIRIDPADSSTNYRHMHIYDNAGNSLDINGNIVSSNNSLAHIPYFD